MSRELHENTDTFFITFESGVLNKLNKLTIKLSLVIILNEPLISGHAL